MKTYTRNCLEEITLKVIGASIVIGTVFYLVREDAVNILMQLIAH